MIHNLNSGDLRKLVKRIEALERANPLSSSSLGRGRMRFYDGSVLLIENGALQVIGTATISGTLDVTGTFNASGVNNLSGENRLTGPTTVDGRLDINGVTTITGDTSIEGDLDVTGPARISGTLDIEGVTTLNNDLNVLSDGQINVGSNMTLTPSADGGSILFQDGSKVTSVGGTIQARAGGANGGGFIAGLNSASISAGNGLISVDDNGDWILQGPNVTLQTIGGTADLNGSLEVSGGLEVAGLTHLMGTSRFFGGVRFNHPQLFLPTTMLTTPQPPNLYMSPSTGQLLRSTA